MKTNVLLFFSQDLFYRSVVPTQPTTVPLSLNIYIYKLDMYKMCLQYEHSFIYIRPLRHQKPNMRSGGGREWRESINNCQWTTLYSRFL